MVYVVIIWQEPNFHCEQPLSLMKNFKSSAAARPIVEHSRETCELQHRNSTWYWQISEANAVWNTSLMTDFVREKYWLT